jgi:16S rRNA (adenine1518-N6/adenine1519-N6)-dimethyltransferase
VIEIGPGTGALTQFLMAQEVQLLCVELDRGLGDYLKQSYGPEGVEVIQGDILAKKRGLHPEVLSWAEAQASSGHKPKWISNLPYNILTPFLWNLLKVPDLWSLGVFLVQKEFIDRLKALPGHDNYGPLSVMSHLTLKVEQVRTVSKGCFWPAPDVESAILAISPQSEAVTCDEAFIEFLKTVFAQRRKVMSKLLKGRFPKDKLEVELQAMDLPVDVRAEKLMPHQLFKLFKTLT